MTTSLRRLIPAEFDRLPSLTALGATSVSAVETLGLDLDAVGVLVRAGDDTATAVGLGADQLAAVGFSGKPGSTVVLPQAQGATVVAVGIADDAGPAQVRDAAAALVRAVPKAARIGLELSAADAATASAAVEGALLARYRYRAFGRTEPTSPLTELQFTAAAGALEVAGDGIARALVTARAGIVARDLTNGPPGHLTATDLAELAIELGAEFGFEAEIFDRDALEALGTGGLLGVNAGSMEEPRMIKLTFSPAGTPTGSLGLVGKGIMYDSGGISLKPSDPMHLLMKMDMGGAAAVLGAFTALRDLGGTSAVTGWLMCTDNMPSGSAMKLGDVLTARNGTTIEIRNTDAEGRLVMCDALALAVEDGVDAIVDVATLTGAALMALGTRRAAMFANTDAIATRVQDAADAADEWVWRLPLEQEYRKQLDSDIADIANLGGKYAGSTTAALFLQEFVGTTPWAHLDIAGTMNAEADESWRSKGATGYGARLLAELASTFTAAS